MKSWASLWRDCTVLMKSRGVMPSRLLEIWLWGNWLTLLFCISSPVLLRCLRFHRLHCLPRYLLGLHLLQSSWDPWQDFWGNYTSLWRVGADWNPWWERPHHGASSPRGTPTPKTCLLPTSLPSQKAALTSSGCNQDCFSMLLLHSFLFHTLDGRSEDPKAGVSRCVQWLLKGNIATNSQPGSPLPPLFSNPLYMPHASSLHMCFICHTCSKFFNDSDFMFYH